MHIVALGWIFVVLLMSLAEATSTQGSVLGAIVTFALYGVLPLSIVLYVMGTPARRHARLRAESISEGDGGGHPADPTPADPPITAKRKEP